MCVHSTLCHSFFAAHIHSRTHIYTYVKTHARTHNIRTRACAHTGTRTHACMLTETHLHTHTLAHTHTHTHTHTQTHTRACVQAAADDAADAEAADAASGAIPGASPGTRARQQAVHAAGAQPVLGRGGSGSGTRCSAALMQVGAWGWFGSGCVSDACCRALHVRVCVHICLGEHKHLPCSTHCVCACLIGESACMRTRLCVYVSAQAPCCCALLVHSWLLCPCAAPALNVALSCSV